MGQLACFQIDQHKTFQMEIIEYQIDIELTEFRGDAFLPGDKGKAFAQFQKKGLNIVDDGLFDFRFPVLAPFFQVKKFQDIRKATMKQIV